MKNTYKVASHVAWRRVDNEVVVLDLNTSVYYSLNEVGSSIWELIVEGQTLDKAVDAVSEDYGEKADAVAEDARQFVRELSQEKLLEAA